MTEPKLSKFILSKHVVRVRLSVRVRVYRVLRVWYIWYLQSIDVKFRFK